MPEHSPDPFARNERLILHFGGEEISDTFERFVACYKACSGLNPETVPELVWMVEKLLKAHEAREGGWSENLKQEAKRLLARVKA